jgi:hypothetical protein
MLHYVVGAWHAHAQNTGRALERKIDGNTNISSGIGHREADVALSTIFCLVVFWGRRAAKRPSDVVHRLLLTNENSGALGIDLCLQPADECGETGLGLASLCVQRDFAFGLERHDYLWNAMRMLVLDITWYRRR